MKLISELTEDVECIVEAAENGKKNFFIEGIIMQGDIKNRNGRVYPSATLHKEMKRYNEQYVDKNRAYGELNHPTGPTINLDRVSHLFRSLKAEGSNVVGRAKILDTPMGQVVKALISEGAQLGISSRGLGSVKQNSQGIMEVQEDFMLATAGDIVADPSAPQAFVNGIMEGADWVYDIATQAWTTRASNAPMQVVEQVVEVARRDVRQLEEDATKLFSKFLRSL